MNCFAEQFISSHPLQNNELTVCIRRSIQADCAADTTWNGKFMSVINRLTERITIDPAVCHGKPIIRGLRYPIEMILELLGAGMTSEEILADYEDLEREDILAVLAYATRLSQIKRSEGIRQ